MATPMSIVPHGGPSGKGRFPCLKSQERGDPVYIGLYYLFFYSLSVEDIELKCMKMN